MSQGLDFYWWSNCKRKILNARCLYWVRYTQFQYAQQHKVLKIYSFWVPVHTKIEYIIWVFFLLTLSVITFTLCVSIGSAEKKLTNKKERDVSLQHRCRWAAQRYDDCWWTEGRPVCCHASNVKRPSQVAAADTEMTQSAGRPTRSQ